MSEAKMKDDDQTKEESFQERLTMDETEVSPIRKTEVKSSQKKKNATTTSKKRHKKTSKTADGTDEDKAMDKREEVSIKKSHSSKNGGKSVSARKGASTPEEDKMIMEGMAELAGEAEKGKWKALADRMGNGRNADFVRQLCANVCPPGKEFNSIKKFIKLQLISNNSCLIKELV
ncbi:5487_t:CDS:2 [Ambispora gerdemannii]|uniref:5487_t:CDS:1 n=1 Tax=Ambispora gerdemannii TaxID=144530 RepID=A0A9N9FQ97_9GLOM|nr:5487_t:CDS:2 [Ambispora gerdemannii]